MDLRDLAKWLNEETRSREAATTSRREAAPTLEEFLAVQVAEQAGGGTFTVDDLREVFNSALILLALDGLDEVVDLDDRAAVVKTVVDGVSRLESIAQSLQVVVTSRPASFSASPGFRNTDFRYLTLRDIRQPLAMDYAARWSDARSLEADERRDLLRTLEAKLSESHIRDLSRNPMQLAILLNLIHRRGPALPDQRTALYTSYMELFLDREADKSPRLRHDRDLVVTVHGYLGWYLHCQAERPGEAGRVTRAELTELVEDFVEARGYQRDYLGELFGGVFDRVGVIVSRVEETYEFEVQPLREYFAAQYLYRTAPYSAAGAEHRGTRPERFDAIARHPYWLNVARFYAGSYDIGELPSLADRLEALSEDARWRLTAHPRTLCRLLLSDRTFQQDRRAQARAVSVLEGQLGPRWVGEEQDEFAVEQVKLPSSCGGREIVYCALARLDCERGSDRRGALLRFIDAHSDAAPVAELWLAKMHAASSDMRLRLLHDAYHLRAFAAVPTERIDWLDVSDPGTIRALLYAEEFWRLDDKPNAVREAVNEILGYPQRGRASREPDHPLPAFASILEPDQASRYGDFWPGELRTTARRVLGMTWPSVYDEVLEIVSAGVEGLSGEEKIRNADAWSVFIERARQVFGDRRALDSLAVLSARIPSPGRGGRHNDLFDDETALAPRARYGNFAPVGWWRETFASAEDAPAWLRAAGLALSWGSREVLEAVRELIVSRLDGVTVADYQWLANIVMRASTWGRYLDRPNDVEWDSGVELSPRLFALLGPRLRNPDRIFAHQELYTKGRSDEAAVFYLTAREVNRLVQSDAEPSVLVQLLRAVYADPGWVASRYQLGRGGMPDSPVELDVETATDILRQPSAYPLALVELAEESCLPEAVKATGPVGETARLAGWFEE